MKGKSLLGFGGLLFVGTMAAATIATESAAQKIAGSQDHEAVLVVEVFAFHQHPISCIRHK